MSATRRFGSGAAMRQAARFEDYSTAISEGMVVLDAVHQIQAEQANDLAVRWNCKAGKCGSCSAEVNGKPRLMCMTRLNQLDLSTPVTVEPMRAFPLIRDLVTDVSWNFGAKKSIKPVQAAAAGRAGWHLAAWRRRTSSACRNSASASSASSARTSATCCATIGCSTSSSGRVISCTPRRSRCIRSITENRARDLKEHARHRLLQHHEVLHEGVSGKHHHHRQRHHSAEGARRRSALRSGRQDVRMLRSLLVLFPARRSP